MRKLLVLLLLTGCGAPDEDLTAPTTDPRDVWVGTYGGTTTATIHWQDGIVTDLGGQEECKVEKDRTSDQKLIVTKGPCQTAASINADGSIELESAICRSDIDQDGCKYERILERGSASLRQSRITVSDRILLTATCSRSTLRGIAEGIFTGDK